MVSNKDPKKLAAEKAELDRLTKEFLDSGGVVTKYKYREMSETSFTPQQFNNSGPTSKGLIDK
jgi:hypothetical protein